MMFLISFVKDAVAFGRDLREMGPVNAALYYYPYVYNLVVSNNPYC